MNTEQSHTLHTLFRRCGMMLLCAAAATATSLAATGWAGSVYIVTDEDDAAIILDPSQEKVPDLSSQLLYISNGSRGYDICLMENTSVLVRHGDTTLSVQSQRESISSLLGRLQLAPSALEMVGVKLADSSVELTVSSELAYYDYVTEKAPFRTVRVENPDMLEGEEKVVQEGSDGVRSSVYEVVWSNGAELSRQFVEELSTTAVDRVVEYGTAKPAPKPAASSGTKGNAAASSSSSSGIANVEKNADGSGTLYLKDGTVLKFSGMRTMSATAYTAGHGGVGTRTASGTAVHKGTVAVDRSVIPLGTRMYIVASGGIVYGLAAAEDTGVRGNKVDLYFDTYEQCIQFGRRDCTVYILE